MPPQMGTTTGELAGVLGRDSPTAEAAHGKAGEIGALRVTLELFACCGQRGQGHFFHLRRRPPMVLQALRQDDDGVESGTVQANGVGQADIGLQQAIRAALAGAVEKKDDRPLLF